MIFRPLRLLGTRCTCPSSSFCFRKQVLRKSQHRWITFFRGPERVLNYHRLLIRRSFLSPILEVKSLLPLFNCHRMSPAITHRICLAKRSANADLVRRLSRTPRNTLTLSRMMFCWDEVEDQITTQGTSVTARR